MDFPQHVERWRPLIEDYFPSHVVDKALWTLMHESSGNPSARNKSSGAAGLFQILPSVHGQRNWTNPEENIKYAAKLYAQSGWKPWGGEGNTYQGKPFGALGKNPFPGDSGTQGRAQTSQAVRSNLPVSSGRITQVFGRTDEPLDSGGTNKGLDISVPTGTSVQAVTGGTVINAGDAGDGWGTSVKVRDAQGNIHNYGHLSRANVSVGDSISSGQTIAKSGNTGASTGPHLSYDVKGTSGQYVDPSPFLGFNAAGDNRQGHPAIGKDISELGGQMANGRSYWSDRLDQINEELEKFQKRRDEIANMSNAEFSQGVLGNTTTRDEMLATLDTNIQNLQGLRDEAHMFAQEEQQASADIALTGAQIDTQRINAAVAEGRLTLDQAIHELNKEIQTRQQALAEETARRTQGRQDAAFIDEQLDQAAAWAPSEPGKTDYSGADVSEAHGQVLEGRGISPDSTIAQYSGTRVVDPQKTLAQAGGGAAGGRGSAPGMGWTDEDRAQGEPAAPSTGTGTVGSPGAGNLNEPGQLATSPMSFTSSGSTGVGPFSAKPPSLRPGGSGSADRGPSPTFSGNAPPTGHPAQTGLLGSQASAGPGYTASDFMSVIYGQNDYRGPGTYSDDSIGPGYDADDYNALIYGNQGLLGGTFRGNTAPSSHPSQTGPQPKPPTFSGNTPPAGHPAMRR